MKQCLNIKNNEQQFKYIVEYSKSNFNIDKYELNYSVNDNTVRLYSSDIQYYRNQNDWYSVNTLNASDFRTDFIPTEYINISKVKIYVPIHSISTYINGVKYMVSLHTYIGNKKVDFGSFMFKPSDTCAIPTGVIKMGNDEYCEYIEFDIIDPFSLVYSDSWKDFREQVCKEISGTNNTGSALNVSMHIVEDYDNRYMLNMDWIGCASSFVIARHEDGDYLNLGLKISNDPLGFTFETELNKVYANENFKSYLKETYNISASSGDLIDDNRIKYQLIIRNSDNVIIGPYIDTKYNELNISDNGLITKHVTWDSLPDTGEYKLFKLFFSDWAAFDEGWVIMGSLTVFDEAGNEMIYLVTNELLITQEVFSIFTNGGTNLISEYNTITVPKIDVINKNYITEDKLSKPIHRISNSSTDIEKIIFKLNDTKTLKTYKTNTIKVVKLN